jgi:uncharacterized protein YjcR
MIEFKQSSRAFGRSWQYIEKLRRDNEILVDDLNRVRAEKAELWDDYSELRDDYERIEMAADRRMNTYRRTLKENVELADIVDKLTTTVNQQRCEIERLREKVEGRGIEW